MGLRRTATILIISMAGLLAWCDQAAASDAPTPKESQVKAAFIFNFLKFAEWPEGKFDDATSPMIIGVVGKGSIFSALEGVVKDRKVNGRDLIVKFLEKPEDIKRVHLLFLPGATDSTLESWLSAAKEAGALTVGESDAFGQHGGIIRFVQEGDKLRFEIDMDSADAARVKISAQLQKLAKTIRRKP